MHNESGKGAEGRLDVLANDATSHRQGQIARCAVLVRGANIVWIENMHSARGSSLHIQETLAIYSKFNALGA